MTTSKATVVDRKTNEVARRKQKGNLTIFLFPYLFLDKELELDGYKLKPSYTTIFNKESSRVRGHLTKIAKSFKYRNTPFINQYTYSWITLHNKKEWQKLRDFLDTFSTLLRYQELSENNGATYSNFDYAVFEINRPMSDRKIEFYQGYLNGEHSLSIHYPETKYCPNFDFRPHIVSVEGDSKVFNHLFTLWKMYHAEEEKNRIIRALSWFNRSFKNDPEVDDFERFISVAVGFEALFNSPAESIQASLSTSITSLLGETPEMMHWVKAFYEQRSKIVHGREDPTVLYKGKGLMEFHLDHLVFARKVFTRCIKAIFTAREQVYTQDLHNELISNERRIKEIKTTIKGVTDTQKLFDNGTFNNIDALSQRDPTGKLSDVMEIGKSLLPLIKGYLTKQKNQELATKVDELLNDNLSDLAGLAVKYSEFHSSFSPIYLGDKSISVKDISILALKGAVYNYTSFMSWKLFREAFKNRG